mgnify:CR=1 FL=1
MSHWAGFFGVGCLDVLVAGAARLDVQVVLADGSVVPVRRWTDDLLYQGPHTVHLPVSASGDVTMVLLRPRIPEAGICVVSADLVRIR